ncbi:hypothetical protein [Kitasatospora sp. NPDC006786]|uniref:hypothetical protein n=1 Tax=unclassified Kitasatospora TaxID=2633591 RepID=UPI0033F691C4
MPRSGLCDPCAGLAPRQVEIGRGATAARTGAAHARAALRAAQTVGVNPDGLAAA